MSGLKAVLFDLDGTLLDSFPAHYVAYESMFAHFGIEISRERFLASYSPNWYRTYDAFGLEPEHWENANSIWLAEAERHSLELFPGTRELLIELSDIYALGIVTSGSRSRVIRDVERLGIKSHFDTIVTGDDVTEPKPAPEGLYLALGQLGVAPQEAAFVGDATADFEMACAAGVRFFGVPSEFANLTDVHPDYDLGPLCELPARLRMPSAAGK